MTTLENDICSRLNTALAKTNLTKAGIGRELSVSRNTVNIWFKSGSMTKNNLLRLAKLLGVNASWLITGDDKVNQKSAISDINNITGGRVNLDICKISASKNKKKSASIAITGKKISFDMSLIQKHDINIESVIVSHVNGDSMRGQFYDGDMILIDTSQKNIIDLKVYAILLAGEYKVKLLQNNYDGSIDVISANQNFKNETIPANETKHLEIIGRVFFRSGII